MNKVSGKRCGGIVEERVWGEGLGKDVEGCGRMLEKEGGNRWLGGVVGWRKRKSGMGHSDMVTRFSGDAWSDEEERE